MSDYEEQWEATPEAVLDLLAERDELRAKVERVRKAHYPTVEMGEQEFCENCRHAYPCPTIRILSGGQ